MPLQKEKQKTKHFQMILNEFFKESRNNYGTRKIKKRIIKVR